MENQINTIKTHVGEIEKLYGDIRSLRHDMGNHIQMVEHLMGTGNTAEASAYLERLKDAFDVSVILYNALNNCMGSVNGEKPYIRIQAFLKNSIFMLIVSNSFEGKLLTNPADGLPYTTKKAAAWNRFKEYAQGG